MAATFTAPNDPGSDLLRLERRQSSYQEIILSFIKTDWLNATGQTDSVHLIY